MNTTQHVKRAGLVRRQVGSITALAGWTLFLWVTRIRNIAGDAELAGFAKVWRLGVSLGFVIGALALVTLLVRARRSAGGWSGSGLLTRPGLVAMVASALAVVGSAWWIVRGGGILLGDHETAFKVVHTVLGLGTIALSGLVLSSTSSPDFGSGR